ncbi:MAG: hypothetical protein J0H66_06850 [Solirubrobacterales bacterium]|nr:hypothetical protein [Solirubrobacterales bacterium]OJU94860.1 MAG: hypothetical protein BGO23_06685 [Solirubrobacterales bacterium 67-14]
MSIVIWFTVALALWHFTIFVPDRFWQGIIGALIGCVVGGLISGALVELVILGNDLADTDLLTFFTAVPGTLVGAWVVYRIGVSQGTEPIEEA